MTIYIAKSLTDNTFIAIKSSMEYGWFNSYEEALLSMHTVDCIDQLDDTIERWLSELPIHNMKLISTFTPETHPELFI